MKKIPASYLLFLLIVALVATITVTQNELSATRAELASLRATLNRSDVVKRAVDGDTVEMESAGKVRLLGVNAPELWEKTGAKWARIENPDPRAVSAYEYLRSLEGCRVRVQTEKAPRDRYGRTLAHLYVLPDGPDVAAHLLRHGWVDVMSIPPNTARHQDWKSDLAAKK